MREFAAVLAARVAPVPVRLVDERLTTVSAEAMLRDQRKGQKRREVIDQAAAVLILQHALDTERSSGSAPGEDRGGACMSQPDPRPESDAFGVLGDPTPIGGRRRRRKSRLPGCLVGLGLVLALLGGALYWGGTKTVDWIGDRFGGGEDYAGPGSGSVAIEVRSGDSATAICRTMAAADVVASVDACVEAARLNPDVTGIQVGTYDLKKDEGLRRDRRARRPREHRGSPR